jgi:hypothetical protein
VIVVAMAIVIVVVLAICEVVDAIIEVVAGVRRERVRRRAELDITPAVARYRRRS